MPPLRVLRWLLIAKLVIQAVRSRGFDIDRMEKKVIREVAEFAARHDDESFFAFAVDANLLCLTSLETWTATLSEYQAKYPVHYSTSEQIAGLRANTGDWAYRAFAELGTGDGFDESAYNEHYHEAMESENGRAPTTSYARAMDALIERLRRGSAFEPLRTTDDFVITWVDHDY